MSVTTRNPTVGVAAPVVPGFAMQLLSTLGGLNLARRLLLTTPGAGDESVGWAYVDAEVLGDSGVSRNGPSA